MARYKPQDRNSLLLPVVLSEQIVPGSFAFALDYLVDHELDLSGMDAKFKNDEVGASAYDPRVMLKVVLLAYSQGLISSRAIERACVHNVQFIAISGDSQPSHAHIAKFVNHLGEQIKPLFSQVLMTCDAQGLIGRDMFAIDGVKLPSNASKERSGTPAPARRARPSGVRAAFTPLARVCAEKTSLRSRGTARNAGYVTSACATPDEPRRARSSNTTRARLTRSHQANVCAKPSIQPKADSSTASA